jgi:hypothetical protein
MCLTGSPPIVGRTRSDTTIFGTGVGEGSSDAREQEEEADLRQVRHALLARHRMNLYGATN